MSHKGLVKMVPTCVCPVPTAQSANLFGCLLRAHTHACEMDDDVIDIFADSVL